MQAWVQAELPGGCGWLPPLFIQKSKEKGGTHRMNFEFMTIAQPIKASVPLWMMCWTHWRIKDISVLHGGEVCSERNDLSQSIRHNLRPSLMNLLRAFKTGKTVTRLSSARKCFYLQMCSKATSRWVNAGPLNPHWIITGVLGYGKWWSHTQMRCGTSITRTPSIQEHPNDWYGKTYCDRPMDFMPCLWVQNKIANKGRYGSWKLPAVLPEMQAWNTDWSSSTEYIRYQRARRTDAEPITHKAILLVVIGFFLFQYATTACPARRGKKKTVAGQVDFVRSLYPFYPAAVLKYILKPPFSFWKTE